MRPALRRFSACPWFIPKPARTRISWIYWRNTEGRKPTSRISKKAWAATPPFGSYCGRLADAPRSETLGHVWTAPGCQGFLARVQHRSGQPCVRPIHAAHTRPLAIMPSADRVPVNSTHSTMPWPKWGVPIARSTSPALHAVCPFQPFLQRLPSAISFAAAAGYLASATGSL